MPTPNIQTLVTDAQQVLNLDSISAVRSVVAVALANANTGTPLNPNLTTQQLWNEFYQVVTKPKSDIESIIANQLMKFLFAPPAPGGVGANGQVIFNDGGVLAGDPQFLWNKTTNLLTVTGSATITGDLAVRTNKLYVTATGVGCGMTPITPLSVSGAGGILLLRTTDPSAPVASPYLIAPVSTGFSSTSPVYAYWYQASGIGNPAVDTVSVITASSERYRIAADGVATWSNVGGVAGTAMTLNSIGLGVGTSPSYKLHVNGTDTTNVLFNGATKGVRFAASASKCSITGVDNTGSATFQPLAIGGASLEFQIGSTTEMTLDASGNLLIGTTSGTYHTIRKNVTADAGNLVLEVVGTGGSTSVGFYGVSGYNANAANSATKVGRDATTLRSINAGGTVNASGADYAEYMTKGSDFVLSKGGIAGIDANGKLTNVFADAVSFVVKSTDPSYVGNDKWGIDLEGDALEAARQLVDRIAFAGQVPVNVTGAKAGDYIVPVVDGTGIKGIAVSNPTFEQYQLAVGKVIAIDADGRARIIVKVA